jgi:hypothetical protein
LLQIVLRAHEKTARHHWRAVIHLALAPEAVAMTPMVKAANTMMLEMMAMHGGADINPNAGGRSANRCQSQSGGHKSRFEKIRFHLLSSHILSSLSRKRTPASNIRCDMFPCQKAAANRAKLSHDRR